MKRLLLSFLLILPFIGYSQVPPVIVTYTEPGGYIRTDRWYDPSSCTTIDRIVCGQLTVACFTITYDDGKVSIGQGGNYLFAEGVQGPTHPVHIERVGEDPIEGTCINYHEYNIVDLEGNINRAFEFHLTSLE
jgi:hypothetical protein